MTLRKLMEVIPVTLLDDEILVRSERLATQFKIKSIDIDTERPSGKRVVIKLDD